jgi:hypothetical protein
MSAGVPAHPVEWAEVVTTALLGTDRRPVAAADPPRSVLEQAARHRILHRLAGPPAVDQAPPDAQRRPAPTPAPAQDRPEAPVAADRLLADLLRTPDPVLVSCWLSACVEHRRVVAALRWTSLVRLAARSTAYDRRSLGLALGPRGRWFLRRNPDWRRLAEDAERPVDRLPPEPVAALTAQDVVTDPQRLLDHPQPWAPELVAAAYSVLGGEGPKSPVRSFATRLGVALPSALYPSIAQAGGFYLLAPEASPARRRAVRDRFVALELAAYARAAIDHAFDGTGTGFSRAEIPHV